MELLNLAEEKGSESLRDSEQDAEIAKQVIIWASSQPLQVQLRKITIATLYYVITKDEGRLMYKTLIAATKPETNIRRLLKLYRTNQLLKDQGMK